MLSPSYAHLCLFCSRATRMVDGVLPLVPCSLIGLAGRAVLLGGWAAGPARAASGSTRVLGNGGTSVGPLGRVRDAFQAAVKSLDGPQGSLARGGALGGLCRLGRPGPARHPLPGRAARRGRAPVVVPAPVSRGLWHHLGLAGNPARRDDRDQPRAPNSSCAGSRRCRWRRALRPRRGAGPGEFLEARFEQVPGRGRLGPEDRPSVQGRHRRLCAAPRRDRRRGMLEALRPQQVGRVPGGMARARTSPAPDQEVVGGRRRPAPLCSRAFWARRPMVTPSGAAEAGESRPAPATFGLELQGWLDTLRGSDRDGYGPAVRLAPRGDRFDRRLPGRRAGRLHARPDLLPVRAPRGDVRPDQGPDGRHRRRHRRDRHPGQPRRGPEPSQQDARRPVHVRPAVLRHDDHLRRAAARASRGSFLIRSPTCSGPCSNPSSGGAD